MAYTKQNFENGQVLSAEHLIKMENELLRSKSWDELADKPFGVELGYSDTLTVPAITEAELDDLINSGSLVADMFLKVSDSILTMGDLENGFSITYLDGINEIPAEAVGERVVQVFDGVLMIDGEVCLSIDESAAGVDLDGLIFPEAGIYVFGSVLIGMEFSLTIPGYNGFYGEVAITLDDKFISENIARMTDIVQTDWNQTDETAADFLKNKPNTEYKYINLLLIDGLYYFCDASASYKLTYSEVEESYRAYFPRVIVNGSPLLRFTGIGTYGVGYFCSQTGAIAPCYTAEYTP